MMIRHCLACHSILKSTEETRYCGPDCSLKGFDRKTYQKQWYNKNHGKFKNYYKKQRAEEPLSKYVYKKLQQRKRATKGKIGPDFSLEEFDIWLNKQKLLCEYCGVDLTHWDKRKETTITLDRLDNSRGYNFDNIVLCCIACNRMRNDTFTYDEMIQIGKTVREVWKKRGF
jgi:hypothetical protein